MRELTQRELDHVSGGLNPIAGGTITAAGYTVMSVSTGQKMTGAGFAGAFMTGFMTSGLSLLGPSLAGAAGLAKNAHSALMGTLYGAATTNLISGNGQGGEVTTMQDSEE